MSSGVYLKGKYTEEFERKFPAMCRMPYCVALSSGTSALELAYQALVLTGYLTEGDKIAIPSNTFTATATAAIRAGLVPVFVDVHSDGPYQYLIDAESLNEAVKQHSVKAVVLVHLYGRLCFYDALMEVIDKHELLIIEDACQAHGASLNNIVAGSIGKISAFSFYPTKNLGALGDAGCILTKDIKLAETVRTLADYGGRHDTKLPGTNSRMDEIQAGILLAKMDCLEIDNLLRSKIASLYDSSIYNETIRIPYPIPFPEHVYHLYVVRITNGLRDAFLEYMKQQGIETGIHYPVPLHKMPLFKDCPRVNCSKAEELSKQIVSLPLYPRMSISHVMRVVEAINNFKPHAS